MGMPARTPAAVARTNPTAKFVRLKAMCSQMVPPLKRSIPLAMIWVKGGK